MNRPILFIHLPRIAGTFLREYADETGTMIYYLYKNQAHYPVSSLRFPEKYFKFGLIRNPFDWYVSQYHYFIDKPIKKRKSYGTFWKIKIPEVGICEGTDAGLWGEEFRNRFPTLKSWIQFGVESKLNNFWLSDLYKYMFYKDGSLFMDYIGKYENLTLEINHLFKMRNIKSEITIENFNGYRNQSRHLPYGEYYDKETANIIIEKDKELLIKYDYKL